MDKISLAQESSIVIPEEISKSSSELLENENEDDQYKPDPIVGAIAAGTVSGLVVGSVIGMPITGSVVGGAGFGYIAVTRPEGDHFGDRVRSIGLKSSIMINKVRKFLEKHRVKERVHETTTKVIEKAKKINEEHHVTERISNVGSKAIEKAKQVDSSFSIREKTVNALRELIKIIESPTKSTESSSSPSPSVAPNPV